MFPFSGLEHDQVKINSSLIKMPKETCRHLVGPSTSGPYITFFTGWEAEHGDDFQPPEIHVSSMVGTDQGFPPCLPFCPEGRGFLSSLQPPDTRVESPARQKLSKHLLILCNLHLCVCVCVLACVNACVSASAREGMCLCVCVNAGVCVCTCIRAHVRVGLCA